MIGTLPPTDSTAARSTARFSSALRELFSPTVPSATNPCTPSRTRAAWTAWVAARSTFRSASNWVVAAGKTPAQLQGSGEGMTGTCGGPRAQDRIRYDYIRASRSPAQAGGPRVANRLPFTARAFRTNVPALTVNLPYFLSRPRPRTRQGVSAWRLAHPPQATRFGATYDLPRALRTGVRGDSRSS